ncbi:glutamyl-tRNA(Gln) amidotransferase subunit A [Labrys miyagiensis]
MSIAANPATPLGDAPGFLSIAEAARQLRSGHLGVRDLVQECLSREQATRHLNAFSDLYADDALALADAHQTLLDKGYDLGPLHGIPLAVKANIAVRGQRMTAGSKILFARRAEQDAKVTQHLKQAGAIVLGATNMHEFAWGGTTANPHFGPTRNAWDATRIPAGSSGGSGVAVAARSTFAALGTDTGGSIRLPAAMNGVTGLRPGVGELSTEGIFPLAWSMDTVGPLARSAEDCALVFAALAGEPHPHRRRPLRDLSHLRIAVPEPYAFAALQKGVDRAFRASLILLRDLGARIEHVEFADLDLAVDAQVIVDAAEPSAVHAGWIRARPHDYGDDVRVLLQAGLAFTAEEYLQAQRYRTLLRRHFDALFADHDLMLTPTLPFTAPRIGEQTVLLGEHQESTLTANMRFTCLASLAALPALSFPIGLDESGLPVGAQLIGGDGDEWNLLACAQVFESALPPLPVGLDA